MAHLVAYFNLVDYISNPKVVEMLDYPDHDKYMTPFQVRSMPNQTSIVVLQLENFLLACCQVKKYWHGQSISILYKFRSSRQ